MQFVVHLRNGESVASMSFDPNDKMHVRSIKEFERMAETLKCRDSIWFVNDVGEKTTFHPDFIGTITTKEEED